MDPEDDTYMYILRLSDTLEGKKNDVELYIIMLAIFQ